MARRRSGPEQQPGRRLLVICHSHPRLSQGGAEITAYEQFRRTLDRAGDEAWFLAASGTAGADKPGVTLTQPFGDREFLYTGGAFDDFKLSNPDPAFAREFGVLLRRLQPDTVHFHHYLGVGIEALLQVRHHLPNARVVVTLHEYLLICNHFGQMVTRPDYTLCHAASPRRCHRCFPERSQQAFVLRELWLKRFLRGVDAFIAPSRFLRDRYVAWGLPPERITVAENVIPLHEPVQPARYAPLEPLRVAFFGQLSHLKGIEILLRAARKLEDAKLPIAFRIWGSYESQPSSFQERVRAALDKLPANVVYKGPYLNADVLALMAANHVIVVPSLWWENSPLVIMEAAAAGCIVIGSDIGGVREKIDALERGATFGYNDAGELASRLVDIYRTGQVGEPLRRQEPADPVQ